MGNSISQIFVLSVIRVMLVVNVIQVVRVGHFPSIIVVISVMCVMRVRRDIHVMSPIPFIIKMCRRHNKPSNVFKTRYEVQPFTICHHSKCYA